MKSLQFSLIVIQLSVIVFLINESVVIAQSSTQQNTKDFLDAIKPKENAVRQLSIDVQSALDLDSWCQSAANCNEKCGIHDCDGTKNLNASACSSDLQSCHCPAPGKNSTTDTCDLCSTRENPALRNIDRSRAGYRTPLGSISSSGDGDNITIPSLPLRRDICALKNIESKFKSAHDNNKLLAWLYAGTTNGAFSKFPNSPFCRDENNPNPLLTCKYNPPTRPWFITAASGPRDIVFLLDVTISKSAKLYSAFNKSLGTLDTRDAISVQLYSDEDRTSVPTSVGSNLTFASNTFINTLRTEIGEKELGLGGRSNLKAALLDAFNILKQAKSAETTSNCNRFIVVMIGADDECFNSCRQPSACTCVIDALNVVEQQQKFFADPVSIILFTESYEGIKPSALSNMERMASSLACPYGAWHRVTLNDTDDSAMAAFPQFAAFLIFDENPNRLVFASQTYKDAAGLGDMFTLAVPIYDPKSRSLVSVVGADILVSEIQSALPSNQSADKEIDIYSQKFRECVKPKRLNELVCEADSLRATIPDSNICAQPVRSSMHDCVAFGDSLYLRGNGTKSFFSAKSSCENVVGGGALAILNSEAKKTFFTSIASPDGTWIGMKAEKGEDLKWIDASTLESNDEFSFDVNDAAKEIFDQGYESVCVTADRRGKAGNWNVEICDKEREYVCELKSSENNPCTNIDRTYAPNCDGPSLNSNKRLCSKEQEEEIKAANPLCKQTGQKLKESDRRCCGKLLEGPKGIPKWIIAIIVAVVIILIIVVIVVVRRYLSPNAEGTKGKTSKRNHEVKKNNPPQEGDKKGDRPVNEINQVNIPSNEVGPPNRISTENTTVIVDC